MFGAGDLDNLKLERGTETAFPVVVTCGDGEKSDSSTVKITISCEVRHLERGRLILEPGEQQESPGVSRSGKSTNAKVEN